MAGRVPAAGERVTLHSLVGRPELHGLDAVVKGGLTEAGRLLVEMLASAFKMAIKLSNLSVAAAPSPPHSHDPALVAVTAATAAAPEEGYPGEELQCVFDPAVQQQLAPPAKKEAQKLLKVLPAAK